MTWSAVMVRWGWAWWPARSVARAGLGVVLPLPGVGLRGCLPSGGRRMTYLGFSWPGKTRRRDETTAGGCAGLARSGGSEVALWGPTGGRQARPCHATRSTAGPAPSSGGCSARRLPSSRGRAGGPGAEPPATPAPGEHAGRCSGRRWPRAGGSEHSFLFVVNMAGLGRVATRPDAATPNGGPADTPSGVPKAGPRSWRGGSGRDPFARRPVAAGAAPPGRGRRPP